MMEMSTSMTPSIAFIHVCSVPITEMSGTNIFDDALFTNETSTNCNFIFSKFGL